MPRKRRLEAVRVRAAWLLACVLWSATFLFIRIGVAEVGPFTFAAARLAVALLVLVPLVVGRREWISWSRGDVMAVVGAGLLLLGVNYALVYWGAQHVPSGLVAIVGTEAMAPRGGGLRGAAAILASACCVAGAYVWMKGRTGRVPPLSMAALQSGSGLLVLATLALAREGSPSSSGPWSSVSGCHRAHGSAPRALSPA